MPAQEAPALFLAEFPRRRAELRWHVATSASSSADSLPELTPPNLVQKKIVCNPIERTPLFVPSKVIEHPLSGGAYAAEALLRG